MVYSSHPAIMQEANSVASAQEATKEMIKPMGAQGKDAADVRVNQELMKLKRALIEAQNNNIKESIRVRRLSLLVGGLSVDAE